MKKFALIIFVLSALSILSWQIWRLTDRSDAWLNAMQHTSTTPITHIKSDQLLGNLVAIQPWMTTHDYANAISLSKKLESYLLTAQQAGLLNEKTIVVWPEYLGTWLVAANEKRSALDAQTLQNAMTIVALTHLPQFVATLWQAPEVNDKAAWTIFTLKAQQMARDYQFVFSTLARQFHVTMVAGSIVLPAPNIHNGQLQVTPGAPLVNVSAVFDPEGQLSAPLVTKRYPIADELHFLSQSFDDGVQVHQTPAGKLAVLICADAWYSDRWQALQTLGAQLVAVPSYTAAQNSWSLPWQGYNPGPTPNDVVRSDIGHISEAEAWQKYAMTARAPAANVRHAVNVFLRGPLWDMGSDGYTLYVSDGQAGTEKNEHTARITSVWIQP
jgi:predicted amidohydrolase